MSAILSGTGAAARPDPRGDDEVARLRIPPHSIEAEQSVLGGLLIDNGAWDRAGDLLSDSDFYRYEHRLIYEAIGRLINATKPADVITVYEQLQSLGKAGFAVVKAQVRMPNGPLKTVGEHAVKVALHTDVIVDVNVTVVGETD